MPKMLEKRKTLHQRARVIPADIGSRQRFAVHCLIKQIARPVVVHRQIEQRTRVRVGSQFIVIRWGVGGAERIRGDPVFEDQQRQEKTGHPGCPATPQAAQQQRSPQASQDCQTQLHHDRKTADAAADPHEGNQLVEHPIRGPTGYLFPALDRRRDLFPADIAPVHLWAQRQQSKAERNQQPEAGAATGPEPRSSRQPQRHIADRHRPLADRRNLIADPGKTFGAPEGVQTARDQKVAYTDAEDVQVGRRAHHKTKTQRLPHHRDQPEAQQEGKQQAGEQRRPHQTHQPSQPRPPRRRQPGPEHRQSGEQKQIEHEIPVAQPCEDQIEPGQPG